MKTLTLPQGLRDLIDRLVPQRVDFEIGADSDDPATYGRDHVADLSDANVVTSQRIHRPEPCHAVVLDIDVPAWLVPSTTEGHSHLYADIQCSREDYEAFLHAAAQIGLVEPGYVAASVERGYTAVRLPWVQKGGGAQ